MPMSSRSLLALRGVGEYCTEGGGEGGRGGEGGIVPEVPPIYHSVGGRRRREKGGLE